MDPNSTPNKSKKKAFPSKRLWVDSIVGTTAGFALSWFITPMDCAVMESMASHKQITVISSLRNSLKTIITRPHKYLIKPEFRFVFGTYSGTYLAKNYVDTICKYKCLSPEKTAFYKFWIVFAVNGGLSVFWKDPGLARIVKTNVAKQLSQSTSDAAKAVAPSMKMTYFWWVARDLTHMFGAAVLPDYCEDKFKLSHKQWQIAQLSFPVITQLFTTPLHLMGLDYFNHQQSTESTAKIGIMDRLKRVKINYVSATGIRMCRMWAPWSIGLLINREFRDYLNGDEHH